MIYIRDTASLWEKNGKIGIRLENTIFYQKKSVYPTANSEQDLKFAKVIKAKTHAPYKFTQLNSQQGYDWSSGTMRLQAESFLGVNGHQAVNLCGF